MYYFALFVWIFLINVSGSLFYQRGGCFFSFRGMFLFFDTIDVTCCYFLYGATVEGLGALVEDFGVSIVGLCI